MQKSTVIAFGLALSVLNLTAQSFSESFDATGALNNFNVNLGNATPPVSGPAATLAGSPYFLVTSGGVGNSGGLSVTNGSATIQADASLIQKNTAFDFSKVGVTLTVSAMINVAPINGGGGKLLQLGFVNENTNGMYNNAGCAFTSLRFNSATTNGNTYSGQYQTKTVAGSTTSPASFPNVTLLAGEWYQLVGSFINLGGGNILAKGFLQDYGTSGVFPEGVVYTFPNTVLTSADIASDTSVYAALRGLKNDGLNAVDNFSAVMVVPEPGTFSLVLLGLAGFAARAWKRKS